MVVEGEEGLFQSGLVLSSSLLPVAVRTMLLLLPQLAAWQPPPRVPVGGWRGRVMSASLPCLPSYNVVKGSRSRLRQAHSPLPPAGEPATLTAAGRRGRGMRRRATIVLKSSCLEGLASGGSVFFCGFLI